MQAGHLWTQNSLMFSQMSPKFKNREVLHLCTMLQEECLRNIYTILKKMSNQTKERQRIKKYDVAKADNDSEGLTLYEDIV